MDESLGPARIFSGEWAAIITEEQLTHALSGMVYPARRWQTIAWADYNCTSEQVRHALHHLPELTYTNLGDVIGTLARLGELSPTQIRR